jgi:hypothetical protein
MKKRNLTISTYGFNVNEEGVNGEQSKPITNI